MSRRRGAKLVTQTWRQWVPDAPALDESGQLTLAEVLVWMKARETSVEPRTIQSWQTKGALPRPVTKVINGRREARYPWWFFDLAAALQDYLARGMSLIAATPILRAEARQLAFRSCPRPKTPPTRAVAGRDETPLLRSLATDSQYERHLDRFLLIPYLPFTYDPTRRPQQLTDFMAVVLGEFVGQIATVYKSAHGFELERAALCLMDKNDRALAFPVPPLPDRAPPPGE